MFVLMIPLTISKGSVKLLLERSFVLLKLFSFIDNNLNMTFIALLLWKLLSLFQFLPECCVYLKILEKQIL